MQSMTHRKGIGAMEGLKMWFGQDQRQHTITDCGRCGYMYVCMYVYGQERRWTIKSGIWQNATGTFTALPEWKDKLEV